MTGKMHFIGGMAVGITTIYYGQNGHPPILLLLGGAALGALSGIFPDIDLENSMADHMFPHLAVMIRKFTVHRGIMHSLLIPVLEFAVLLISSLYVRVSDSVVLLTLSLIAGHLMHMIQDTCTKSGIPWLFPFSRNRISIIRIKSGNKLEIPITIILILGIVSMIDCAFGKGFPAI